QHTGPGGAVRRDHTVGPARCTADAAGGGAGRGAGGTGGDEGDEGDEGLTGEVSPPPGRTARRPGSRQPDHVPGQRLQYGGEPAVVQCRALGRVRDDPLGRRSENEAKRRGFTSPTVKAGSSVKRAVRMCSFPR